jgi:hypothetical protein
MYSPQVQREPAWELLRTSILAAEDEKSTSDRMRVLSKYRKTTAAMVHAMDIAAFSKNCCPMRPPALPRLPRL